MKEKNSDTRMKLITLGISPEKIHACEFGVIVNGNINLEGKLNATDLFANLFAVFGSLNISHNALTTLDYLPKIVTKTFDCSHNSFESFNGHLKHVETLICTDNPNLQTLDFAPCYSTFKGDLLKTKINPEEVCFYQYANQHGIWNSEKTTKENLDFACHEFPEIFKEDWYILEEYRSAVSPTRGRAAGTNTGIL